jgi:AcrR family transcriptional regulator
MRTPPKKTRRRPDEIRKLVLEAARELFTEQGYDATTTKGVAEHAGVLENLIFSNFGSKADLFDAAIVGPFTELVSAYAESWTTKSAQSTHEERIRSYISGLFDLATKNKTLLLSVLAMQSEGSQPGRDILDHIAISLRAAADIYTEEYQKLYPDIDVVVGAAAVGSMVLGSVLLEPMVFPRGRRRPGRNRVHNAITRLILAGVNIRRALIAEQADSVQPMKDVAPVVRRVRRRP